MTAEESRAESGLTGGAAEPAIERASIRGERGAALVSAAQSVQARASNILAAGLMIILGGGALSWYYAHALARPARVRQGAQASAVTRAQGEMPLPALGPIEAPGARERIVAAPAPAVDWQSPEEPRSVDPSTDQIVAVEKSPQQLARERRLSGAVFTPETSGVRAGPSPRVAGATEWAPAGDAMDARAVGATAASDLSALLTPTLTPAVAAQRLTNTRFLLPKGAFLDCTLETAIDSTLPGMTTCITAADTFGADGRVVLLERGTKLVGETRGQVQQGQARVFVLWTQARTPTGVLMPLDAPGTDELGRAGLPGEVDRHFWQRFGAGILVSLIDGASQAGVQSANHSGGPVVYAPSSSRDVVTEVFRDTLHIAPTVTKRNGDRIQILVARDVDFRPVYELRPSAAP